MNDGSAFDNFLMFALKLTLVTIACFILMKNIQITIVHDAKGYSGFRVTADVHHKGTIGHY